MDIVFFLASLPILRPRMMQIIQAAGNIFSEQRCLEAAGLQRVGGNGTSPEALVNQGIPGFLHAC